MEPWWVQGRDVLQGMSSGIEQPPLLGKQLHRSPQISPCSPLSSLHPAAPSAPHVVCHSDRFKQTRLGLIRLRLGFLQRSQGPGRKAAGRQQTGGQARAGTEWIMGQGGEGKQGPPGPQLPPQCSGSRCWMLSREEEEAAGAVQRARIQD